jgi:NAD(P)H-hydrate epimerase
MPSATDRLYHPADVASIDRQAMRLLGLDEDALMARAADSLWRLLRHRWPTQQRLTALIGPGNNGGDGLVVARLAKQAGYQVTLVSAWPTPRFEQQGASAAKNAWTAWRELGGEPPQRHLPCQPGVLLDAMFGAGLDRPLEGDWLHLLQQAKHCQAPVLAVDIPSGLAGDRGSELPEALPADATLCVVALKLGLFTGRGADVRGELYFDDLGCPGEAPQDVPTLAEMVTASTSQALPPRRPGAHKGESGQALLIGGSKGMPGAIALCAEACARGGAGLTRVWTDASHASMLATRLPEAIWQGLETPLPRLENGVNAVGIGPGMGRDAAARRIFQHAMGQNAAARKPMVIDADGLYWLRRSPRQGAPLLITPHPGEAAMLLDSDVTSIEANRPEAVRRLAKRYQATAVLKGAGTLISDGQRIALCPHGNPGMACGGMGDVLCGLITSLLAQGLSPWNAACWGVSLHAASGDLAAGDTPIGLLASDLMPGIRRLRNQPEAIASRVTLWRGARPCN